MDAASQMHGIGAMGAAKAPQRHVNVTALQVQNLALQRACKALIQGMEALALALEQDA